MHKLILQPQNNVYGEIELPGSKSISNRALLMAALAEKPTTLFNLLRSDDTKYMLVALQELGIKFASSAEHKLCKVFPNHLQWQAGQKLYLGNAGTAMRSLTAILTLKNNLANENDQLILTGDRRMQERPIYPLIDALRQVGAEIHYARNDGYPPLHIKNKGINGGKLKINGNLSSQYITALLLTLPLAPQDSQIEIIGDLVSKPYIDITINMLNKFSINVEHKNYNNFYIQGSQQYKSPVEYYIESDASSASYFLAAAAIKGEITVKGIGSDSIQGDQKFAEVLAKMGANVQYSANSIRVKASELKGIDVDLNHIPDAAMTLATTALFAKGTTTIRNIYNWRIKETDRLKAMSNELKKVGAIVTEGYDFITIVPPETIQHAEIETYNDHRMAMCFALLALAKSGVTILDPECTNKTFPDFFTKFNEICR